MNRIQKSEGENLSIIAQKVTKEPKKISNKKFRWELIASLKPLVAWYILSLKLDDLNFVIILLPLPNSDFPP